MSVREWLRRKASAHKASWRGHSWSGLPPSGDHDDHRVCVRRVAWEPLLRPLLQEVFKLEAVLSTDGFNA